MSVSSNQGENDGSAIDNDQNSEATADDVSDDDLEIENNRLVTDYSSISTKSAQDEEESDWIEEEFLANESRSTRAGNIELDQLTPFKLMKWGPINIPGHCKSYLDFFKLLLDDVIFSKFLSSGE